MTKCLFCNEPANNVSSTHCNYHIDRLRLATRDLERARVSLQYARYPFYSPEIDAGQFGDGSEGFQSLTLFETKGNTLAEYRENAAYEINDQDGGTVAFGGYADAPQEIQDLFDREISNRNWDIIGSIPKQKDRA